MEDLFYSNDEPLFLVDVKKAKDGKDEELRAQLLRWKRDFHKTFCQTPEGRRVLWFIIKECGYYASFNELSARAYAFIGRRAIAQEILDIIGADMVQDSLIKTRNEELRRREGNKNADSKAK